jgi:hypothetical protein
VPAALALLPSALLGPAVWRPVARRLTARGWDVWEQPSPMESIHGPEDVIGWYLDALPAGRPVVVVAHSNAGLYLPTLTLHRRVEAMVFVDAGVPPVTGDYPLAPPSFLTFLEGIADGNGLLPVWTEWWGVEDLARLLPSPIRRREVEADQRQLPLHYFTCSLTAPAGWDARPAAYLAFGATYDADRAEAVRRGWATRTMDGGHLHMVVDPDGVTEQIAELLAEVVGS